MVVILLNGRKIEVTCDPNAATAGQIFEVCITSYLVTYLLTHFMALKPLKSFDGPKKLN